MSDSATLVFSTGTRLGALPVQHVVETMRPLPIEPWSGAASFIDGVAVVRGNAVPVVNVEALLTGTRGAVGRFITIRAGDRCAALGVASVVGIRSSTQLDRGELPPLLLDGHLADVVASLGRLDAQLLLVLRTGSLVPPEVWAGFAGREAAG
jgi:purine-binding chemotaxis protein CheW